MRRYTQLNYLIKESSSNITLTKDQLQEICNFSKDLKLEYFDKKSNSVDSPHSKNKLLECVLIGFDYCIVHEVKVDVDFLSYKKQFNKIKNSFFAKELYEANIKLASDFYGIDKRLLTSGNCRLKGLIKKIEQL